MEISPPRFADFETTDEWKVARARYFEGLTRREQSPETVERVRTEYVEVVREVPVEIVREVEVVRTEYVDRYLDSPVEIDLPEFLRFDPLSQFLSEEARDGETDEATLYRLRSEIADLLADQRDGAFPVSAAERLRHLTAHIKMSGE